MEKNQKHQYGFAIMNYRTGGCRRKSFWGIGLTEADCKKEAARQAHQYAESLTEQAYQKAYNKARSRGDYAPSYDSYRFQVVGCSLWK